MPGADGPVEYSDNDRLPLDVYRDVHDMKVGYSLSLHPSGDIAFFSV